MLCTYAFSLVAVRYAVDGPCLTAGRSSRFVGIHIGEQPVRTRCGTCKVLDGIVPVGRLVSDFTG